MAKISIERILKTPTAKKLLGQSSSNLDASNANDFEHQLHINLDNSDYYGNVAEAIAAAIKNTAGLGFSDSECQDLAGKIVGQASSKSGKYRDIVKRGHEVVLQQFTQPKLDEQEENLMGKVGDKDRGYDQRMYGNWGDSHNVGSTGNGSNDFLMRPGEASGPGKSPFPGGQMQMAQQVGDMSEDTDAQYEIYKSLVERGLKRKRTWKSPKLTDEQKGKARSIVDKKNKSKGIRGPEPLSGIPSGFESGHRIRDVQMGNTGQREFGQSHNLGGTGWETAAPSVYGGTDGTYGP